MGSGALRSPATRRRGDALERALLDAAWEELTEAGYANMTMDGVAARARTSKPVLYRRWPTRAQLVIAAVRAHLPEVTPAGIRDTGSLRGDLAAALTVASRWYNGPVRPALHGVMADFYSDPQLSALLHSEHRRERGQGHARDPAACQRSRRSGPGPDLATCGHAAV